MGYITAIKFAVLVFPVLAFVLTLPYVIVQYFKYGSVSFLRSLILYTFIFYLLSAYFLVIMPLPHRSEVGPGRELNLVPFKFVEKFKAETVLNIHDSSTYLAAMRQECLYVVLFNVLMTMPFGMYMRYYFRQNIVTTTILTFALSAFFEFTQYTGLYFIYEGSYRICDVDDLIQNTFGGILGYILMCIVGLIVPVPTRDDIDKKAYTKGLRVSGLRRSVMFLIDFLVYGLITLVAVYKVGKWYTAVTVCTFIVYYVLFPVIFGGRTFGCCVTRLKIAAPNHKYIRMIFRNIFVDLYYTVVPVSVALYLVKGTEELPTSTHNKLLAAGVMAMAILMFYFIHAVGLWASRRMYYDAWFKTSFVSTIKVAGAVATPEDASGYIPSKDDWLVKPSRKMFTNPLEFAEEARAVESGNRRVRETVPDEDRAKPVRPMRMRPSDNLREEKSTITDAGYDLWSDETKNK